VAGSSAASSVASGVTVVTQTRVRAEAQEAFAHWQERVDGEVGVFPGFVDREVIPPDPPAQVDWVILQRFASEAAALAWLRSDERRRLVEAAQPMLVGNDDVHLVADGQDGPPPAPVSAVISTRLKPGAEAAYRAWEQRIAAAQAHAPGFQGYKLTPPIPGVQDDWVAILKFDSEDHLNGWMASPERTALLADAGDFTDESHTRVVRTGFDQWFRVGAGTAPPPAAWKQNMLVLLALYPVVFLFGLLVGAPLLGQRLGMPFWLSLFVGNAASTLILSRLVPLVSERFGWWLRPGPDAGERPALVGAAVVVALYALSLFLFARVS